MHFEWFCNKAFEAVVGVYNTGIVYIAVAVVVVVVHGFDAVDAVNMFVCLLVECISIFVCVL